MTGMPLKPVVVAAVLVMALACAGSTAADGTPTPAGTASPTASPTGTPWPPPTGIELTSTVTVLNPDGSFMAPELRTMTNTITWDASGGFTGVYEVQRSRRGRHSSETKDFKQLNVVFPASASQGKLRQADTVGFIEALGYEFCYRVRAVSNGENGPFSPELCTIAPPSSGPVPAAQTSVPGHPLQVLYGPQPPGTFIGYGGAEDTTGLLSIDTLAGIRSVAPQSLPATLRGYWLVNASGRAGNGLFSAQARFRGEGDRLLIVRSWTKTGAFATVVPANSPVTEVTQTYIEGLAALTLLPTIAVVGGIGPREIWMTDGSTMWHLELMNYSDNAEAHALAAELARAVQSPGAPDTGTTRGRGSAEEGLTPGLLIATGVVVSAALSMVAARSRGRKLPAR